VISYHARPVRLSGRLGAAFRARGPTAIIIQRAVYPQRHYRRFARARSFPDGGFDLTEWPTRNSVYRVIPDYDHARSPGVEVFVYPRARFHFAYDQASGMIRGKVGLRFDPAVPLRGHAGFIYLDRVRQRKLVELGRGVITGSRGRATFTTSFAPVRHLGQTDTLLWCVHDMTALGAGYPDIVNADCGRTAIHLR